MVEGVLDHQLEVEIESKTGMDFNSTWKRRHPLILCIKERSLSFDSASILLSEGSEVSHLCRERNWIQSLFRRLIEFNSHARAKAGVTFHSGVVMSIPSSPAINFYRGYRNKLLRVRLCISLLGIVDW